MRLEFEGKRNIEDILKEDAENGKDFPKLKTDTNKLIAGDNLRVMKLLLQNGYKGKVDLIYIDPPFATNTVFRIEEGRANTISMSNRSEIAYRDTLTGDAFLSFMRGTDCSWPENC